MMNKKFEAIRIVLDAYWGDMLKFFPDRDNNQGLFVLYDDCELIDYVYGDWADAWCQFEESTKGAIELGQDALLSGLDPLIAELLVAFIEGE